jgi:hypothetical protein
MGDRFFAFRVIAQRFRCEVFESPLSVQPRISK